MHGLIGGKQCGKQFPAIYHSPFICLPFAATIAAQPPLKSKQKITIWAFCAAEF